MTATKIQFGQKDFEIIQRDGIHQAFFMRVLNVSTNNAFAKLQSGQTKTLRAINRARLKTIW